MSSGAPPFGEIETPASPPPRSPTARVRRYLRKFARLEERSDSGRKADEPDPPAKPRDLDEALAPELERIKTRRLGLDLAPPRTDSRSGAAGADASAGGSDIGDHG